MLKDELNERTWFYDLEWVPDANGARRMFDLPADSSELDAMNELWRYSGASETLPRPFVKYLFSRVVSIAFLSRNVVFVDGSKTVEFKLHSLPKLPVENDDCDEAYIIGRFLHFIGERDPHLVGYNSSQSDIQVLIQRGLVNEVTAEKFCLRPSKPWEGRDYFYKYSEEHLDLLTLLSKGNGMSPKLDELAKLCGFPGKIDVDGSQVVDLWLARDLTKIIQYNQIDVLNTYLVWLRIVHFCGKLRDDKYFAEIEIFRDFLKFEATDQDNVHIRQFIEAWPE
ncbi:MAG TPA: ribonuclease H-like domain-containing protein [Pyrinomonadaceae bacterium]|nr:ribonuclease H-like domain-containing protein [Pyrinomonadaceae bacterium]